MCYVRRRKEDAAQEAGEGGGFRAFSCFDEAGQKQVGEQRAYFSLHFHITVQPCKKPGQAGTRGRNLEGGAGAETEKGTAY